MYLVLHGYKGMILLSNIPSSFVYIWFYIGTKVYELDIYEFLSMSLVTLDLLIKDLFYDLIYRASNLLEQNFDVTYDKRLIRNMLYDLQIVPQYAVFYYMDRVEIYRCDSETEEYNFIFPTN